MNKESQDLIIVWESDLNSLILNFKDHESMLVEYEKLRHAIAEQESVMLETLFGSVFLSIITGIRYVREI